MTTRTPPPNMYPIYGKEPKEDKTEKPKEIDYNSSNTNKAGINQSPVGGNNNTTTNENIPVNRGYRQPVPYDNYGALFDIEYHYIPHRKEKDIKKEEPTDDVNRKREFDTGLEDLEAVPEAESDMASEGYRMNNLEVRSKQQSAKIHDLERELRNVRIENNRIKGQLIGTDDQNGFNERGGHLGRISERYETQPNSYPEPRYPEMYQSRPDAEVPPGQGRRQYKNEQHNVAHRQGGPDEEPYWGFNRYYDPQYVTAYRREHIPYYTKMEEREKEEEWRRKRQEEEDLVMKDKPKTYAYTAPYQAREPPRDVNKYFHDSKFLDSRPEPKPDEYYFSEAQPGGLYLIRFHDTGFDEVRLSFREQQTLIKTYEGRVLGIARKHNVYAVEGDPDWHYSKNHYHRQQVHINYKSVDDAIAVLWFPSKQRAIEFYGNHHRNRFQEHNFPTPHSFEAHYIAMLAKPFLRALDTYLVLEVQNANRYSGNQIQKFESETRDAILQFMPNCIPFIASTMEGHYTLKPGSTTLFKDKHSKIFASLFSSMSEISELWAKGIIQYKLSEWNITGPINVWAFALKDWQD